MHQDDLSERGHSHFYYIDNSDIENKNNLFYLFVQANYTAIT